MFIYLFIGYWLLMVIQIIQIYIIIDDMMMMDDDKSFADTQPSIVL
jgi:hypothetical protein